MKIKEVVSVSRHGHTRSFSADFYKKFRLEIEPSKFAINLGYLTLKWPVYRRFIANLNIELKTIYVYIHIT